MKHARAAVLAIVVPCFFVLCSLKRATVAAQEAEEQGRESMVSLEVAAVDEIAAQDVANHHIHIHRRRSAANNFPAAGRFANHPNTSFGSGAAAVSESMASSMSVPSLPSPGFYPADLSDTMHGKVLSSTHSNNIYVNCGASCWGSCDFPREIND